MFNIANSGLFPQIMGCRLVKTESAYILDEENPIIRIVEKRSLKERLLSWPWRPWVTIKIRYKPNVRPAILKSGDTIYYHPFFEHEIKRLTNGNH